MYSYLIKRLLLAIPTIWIAATMVFLMLRLVPGSAVDLILAMHNLENVSRPMVEEALGLNVPIHIQYVRWMGGLLRGDLGDSFLAGKNVTEEIAERLPVTFELSVLAVLIGTVIAIPIGIYSAIRQDTWGDYLGRSFAIINIAVPAFWIGTMIMVYPPMWWGWSPPVTLIKLTDDPLGNLGMFIIPAFILGMNHSGGIMRMTRTMMLEVLRQDYVRTAWAKGLKERVVVTRHALKNALIPVVTIMGTHIPQVIGGAVIIENIFSLPGIGNLLVDATYDRDYPIISGTMLLIGGIVLVTNIIVDMSYGWLDPRIRYR